MTYISDIPIYPDKTHVPLKKRKWVAITRDILRREGMENIPVYIEPGEYFYWKEDRTLIHRFVRWLRSEHEPQVLGSHLYKTNWKKEITSQSLHIREKGSAGDIMDTIVHEIAHVKCPHEKHNDTWKKEYERLFAKYVITPTTKSGNDKGRVEPSKYKLPMSIGKIRKMAREYELEIEGPTGKVYVPSYELSMEFASGRISFDELISRMEKA